LVGEGRAEMPGFFFLEETVVAHRAAEQFFSLRSEWHSLLS
jgi:hypothetical protein